jgi:phosphonate degradation associated HDIG domain protein
MHHPSASVAPTDPSRSPKEIVDHVFRVFRERGHLDYGENVTEAQHALQCATLARAEGEPSGIITACLLHDFGHLVHDLGQDIAKQGVDARHESIGANRLASMFVDQIVEPVRLHVAAKRYLCWKDREYRDALSVASRESLELQGGPMTEHEAHEFEANPHWQAAIRVRHYDDMGKIEDMVTPDFEEFRAVVESFVLNARSAGGR